MVMNGGGGYVYHLSVLMGKMCTNINPYGYVYIHIHAQMAEKIG